MSKAANTSHGVIERIRDLAAWLEEGATAQENLVIGSEHEKILIDRNTGYTPEFSAPDGIEALLKDLKAYKWQGVTEGGRLIELVRDMATISLEPGGQIEHATPIYKSLHDVSREVSQQIDELVAAADARNMECIGLGYHPVQNYKNLPHIPKSRYESFDNLVSFLKKPDDRSLQVLYTTSATQANLGFRDEADMVKKLRIGITLQPVITALFANSPFADGRPSGYKSTRSIISRNAIGGRYGFMLPVAFEDGFGFERYAQYALNEMPLLGVYQDGEFCQTHNRTFAEFMQGKLDICNNRRATLNDWENHLNCIWPEVRLRRFLEMRGADSGPLEMIKALPALWIGLLYDDTARDAAYEMIQSWTNEDREYLRNAVPKFGLQTKFKTGTVQDLAKNILLLAEEGLQRRGDLNISGEDESLYLEPLKEIAESGLNWADRLITKYNGPWRQDIRCLFNELSYRKAPSVLTASSPFRGKPPRSTPKV